MYEVTDDAVVYDGWKVVKAWSSGLLHSVIVSSLILYTPSIWTLRQEEWGPMAVFKNKKAAFRFRDWLKSRRRFAFVSVKVIKCRYVPSDDEDVWTPNSIRPMFWRSRFPEGTYFADAVMVLPEKCRVRIGVVKERRIEW